MLRALISATLEQIHKRLFNKIISKKTNFTVGFHHLLFVKGLVKQLQNISRFKAMQRITFFYNIDTDAMEWNGREAF